jgi:hypothetical protein
MVAEHPAATVPPEAHALTLFRILPNGEGRRYSATTFPRNPFQGCERMVRTARAVGWIAECGDVLSYGLLEVLDESGDILADFDIPNAAAFARLKKKLNIVVEEVEERGNGHRQGHLWSLTPAGRRAIGGRVGSRQRFREAFLDV